MKPGQAEAGTGKTNHSLRAKMFMCKRLDSGDKREMFVQIKK